MRLLPSSFSPPKNKIHQDSHQHLLLLTHLRKPTPHYTPHITTLKSSNFQDGRGYGRCCVYCALYRVCNDRRNVSTTATINPAMCNRMSAISCADFTHPTASSVTTAAPPLTEPLPPAPSATTASSSPTTYPAVFNEKASSTSAETATDG